MLKISSLLIYYNVENILCTTNQIGLYDYYRHASVQASLATSTRGVLSSLSKKSHAHFRESSARRGAFLQYFQERWIVDQDH